jgi:hypothetical protein
LIAKPNQREKSGNVRFCEFFVSFYEVFGLGKKPHIEWPREHGFFWGFLGLFGGGLGKKKLAGVHAKAS